MQRERSQSRKPEKKKTRKEKRREEERGKIPWTTTRFTTSYQFVKIGSGKDARSEKGHGSNTERTRMF
jgi:hypothetical protein